MKITSFLLILSMFCYYSGNAQPLSGTKSIPGDYPTIQAAISALNTNGVNTGGVTFNIAAGHSETLGGANAGLINYTCSSPYYSSVNAPVVFQKSGSGANPLITAFTPGTSTSTDGIIVLAGASYVTFDGIDLQENAANTTATMQMEWGYAFVKKNSTAPFIGCQNNIIRNCNIQLNKLNLASAGIHFGDHVYNSTSSLYLTAVTDETNNCKIYGNSISNVFCGIDLEGNPNNSNYYDQNNEIGVTAGNTITNFGGSGGNPSGIYAICQNNIKIANNTISGGSGSTGNLYGINTAAGTGCNVDIYSNTITLTPTVGITTFNGLSNTMGNNGSTPNTVNIYNNILENFTAPSSISWQSYYLYQGASANNVNIYGNIIRNNVSYGSNYLSMIYNGDNLSGSNISIHDNQMYNLSVGSSTTIYAIEYNCSTGATGNIFNNIVHGLYSNGGNNTGIKLQSGGTTNVYKNRIYDITTDGNGYSGQGLPNGIYSSGITTLNLYNNYISDVKAPTTGYGYNADAIDLIYLNTGTTANIINNTLYLNASSIYVNFRTACINVSNNFSGNMLLQNNILVNMSTVTGAGNFATALRRPSTSLSNYSSASNNNLFYCGIPSTMNILCYDGTNMDQTLAGFQARVTPRESNSIAEMPPFISTAAFNLHLTNLAGTAIESGGQVVTTPYPVTTDYDGESRYPNAGYPNNPSFPATAPDIGADEFAGSKDNNPPVILYTPLTDPFDNNMRTLTATIVDAGRGIPVSGTGLPVLYWKKTGQAVYTGVQGVSAGSGQYTFSFGGGVSSGDLVSYYVAAQDLIVPANVSCYPLTGASGFTSNPPAVSTPPSNPSTYTVQSPMAGVKTIPGDFPSIQVAIATLSYRGVGQGGVIFNVAAGYTETLTSANGGMISYTGTAPPSGQTNPVTFQKAGTGANPVITAFTPGTSTSVDGIIKIAGADYVTFDGIDVRENLLNTNSAMQMEWGYAVLKKNTSIPLDGCQNVTIKNCNITLNKANPGSTGIYVADHTAASVTTLTPGSSSDANNNIRINGNNISNVYYGLSIAGYGPTIDMFDQNNEIGVTAGNTITNFGGGSVSTQGIFALNQNNLSIANNIINGGNGSTNNLYGINTGVGTGCNVNIYGNTISLNSSTVSNFVYGIYNSMGNAGSSPNTVNIYNNTVENMTNTTGSGSYMYGIFQYASPNNVNIYGNIVRNLVKPGLNNLEGIIAYSLAANGTGNYYNNQVYNLTSTGTPTVYGMDISAPSTGTISVYGNTVHGLSTNGNYAYGISHSTGVLYTVYKNRVYDIQTGTSGFSTYGMYFTGGIGTINVYNNYVSDLRCPNTNNSNAVNGIYYYNGGTINMVSNTIYLAATSTFGFSTSAVAVWAGGTNITLKNNIIVNRSSSTFTGTYYTFGVLINNNPTFANYGAESDNNIIYCGLPGTHNVLFSGNGIYYQTLAGMQAALAPRDANSATEFPPFVDIANNDLHIKGGVETKAESGGKAVSSPFAVTDDWDGNPRYPNAGYPSHALDLPSAPDIGADEFAGGHYHNPPVISYTPLANPTTNNAQTLTATITDPTSGVPTSGVGLPVLYWRKKGVATYSSVQGLYVGNSHYNFTFGAGVASGDSIFYYIVAQGTWPIPNVGSNPSTLAYWYSFNPPTVSNPPVNPSSYLVQSPISGTFLIGGSNRFPTLTGAGGLFQYINTVGLSGNLTALITTDLTEPGTYALNQWTEAGQGGYSLAIQPDGTTQRVVSSTSVTSFGAMINFNGADRVTLDGGSGKYLLFRNTYSYSGVTGPTIQFTNGATVDSVKNCVIENNTS